MKKTYEKPILTKRARLASIAALVVVVSGPVA
jgi:hypothetical protein